MEMLTPFLAGIVGGQLGYRLLQRIAGVPAERASIAYENRSKLEALFGPTVWSLIEGRQVIDFGCGTGRETVDVACHGAQRVIGLDIREKVLELGRQKARAAGVLDRCAFVMDTDEQADVIISIDGFEHYGDPEATLRAMRRMIRPDGHVLIAFGPPWFHPLGGHLFSVFPWAHLVFTERAFIRWRARFKSDGATRFSETEGGLNRMTIRRFRRLVQASDFEMEAFEAVPIRRLGWLSSPLTREFLTSVVRCRLVPRRRRPQRKHLSTEAA
jgi:SAM-dependent methyltransferase